MYFSTFFTHIEEAIEAVDLAIGHESTKSALKALKGELRQLKDVKNATSHLCGSGYRLHSDIEQVINDIECVIHRHEQIMQDEKDEALIIQAHESTNRFTGELVRVDAQQ